MSHSKKAILLTASGDDHPGITSAFTRILAENGTEILDITQAVIQNLLSLSILYRAKSESASRLTHKALKSKGEKLGLKMLFRTLNYGGVPARKKFRYAVTLISETVTAAALYKVTSILAQAALNIDFIKRLTDSGFGCVEILVSSERSIQEQGIRKKLLLVAKKSGVDIAFQLDGLYRRSKRLVVLDMDSTLIQNEVIDELARESGVYKDVAAITRNAMEGKLNYDESLRQRCEMLKGLTTNDLEKVYRKIQLTAGAEELIQILKKLGYKIALISGGFSFVADRLKEKLGLDFVYANQLELRNGILTGRVTPPIVNAQRKADLLEVIAQKENVRLEQVIAIGDGANDLLMLEKAGLGIAFNAKPQVREKADLALSQKTLRSILHILGLSEDNISEALTSSSVKSSN